MRIILFLIVMCIFLSPYGSSAMEVDHPRDDVHVLFEKGQSCMRDSNWMDALGYFTDMIPYYKQNEKREKPEQLLFAKAFSAAGNICQLGEQYIQALDFYILGLEAAENSGDNSLYDRCLGNIGNIYMLFKDYENALLYYNKGYNRCVSKNDSDRQVTFLTNIISAYCYMNQPDKAKECYLKLASIPVRDTEMQTFYNLINQALIAQTEKNYSGAVYFHEKALEYAHLRVLDERFIVAEYRELSMVYRAKGELKRAIEYLLKGEQIATKKGYTMQKAECYKLLSELYAQSVDSGLASHYRTLYVSFSDSINQREYNKVKNKLVRYEEQQNNSYIGKLSERINMQRWIIVFVSVCFMLVLALIIYIFRQNRKLQHAYQTLFNRNSELIDSDRKYKQTQMKYLAVSEELNRYRQEEAKAKNEENAEAKNEEQADKKLPLVLSSEHSERLLEDILRIMEDGHSIYNPEFSLNHLAKLVNSNTKYVSWIINDTYNKNFRTFLNEYRIREASKRLLNTEKYGSFTIQAIAEDVGFKSVTNFVVAFKKNVGITPSLYQKMARKEVEEEEPEC